MSDFLSAISTLKGKDVAIYTVCQNISAVTGTLDKAENGYVAIKGSTGYIYINHAHIVGLKEI